MIFLVAVLLFGLIYGKDGANGVRDSAFNLVVDDADGLCGRSMCAPGSRTTAAHFHTVLQVR